jgi:hypothetical protein
MQLRSVPAFKKAVDDNDSYAMYTIAKEEHSRSSSFAVVQSIFQQLLSVKMDGPFSKLVHDLTDHRRKFDAIFDKAATGTVRTDDIWVMILMNALSDDQFLFMKETMYSKDLKDAFQDMQNYDLNRRKPASKPEPTAQVGSTILSASSPNFSSAPRCSTRLCAKLALASTPSASMLHKSKERPRSRSPSNSCPSRRSPSLYQESTSSPPCSQRRRNPT